MVRPSSPSPRGRRFWIEVTIVVVLLATFVLDVVFVFQPSGPSSNATGAGLLLNGTPAARAPMPTVLPTASPATTLAPPTPAEQAAFTAGQRSCQAHRATTPAPANAAEQAAFKAGHQWCQSSPAGHHRSASKP